MNPPNVLYNVANESVVKGYRGLKWAWLHTVGVVCTFNEAHAGERDQLQVGMSVTASIRQRGDLGTDGETGSLFLRSDRRTTVIPWLRRYRRSDVYLIVAVLTGLAVVLVLVLAMVMEVGSWADERIARPYTEAELPHDPQQRAIALLKAYPVVDG